MDLVQESRQGHHRLPDYREGQQWSARQRSSARKVEGRVRIHYDLFDLLRLTIAFLQIIGYRRRSTDYFDVSRQSLCPVGHQVRKSPSKCDTSIPSYSSQI